MGQEDFNSATDQGEVLETLFAFIFQYMIVRVSAKGGDWISEKVHDSWLSTAIERTHSTKAEIIGI